MFLPTTINLQQSTQVSNRLATSECSVLCSLVANKFKTLNIFYSILSGFIYNLLRVGLFIGSGEWVYL